MLCLDTNVIIAVLSERSPSTILRLKQEIRSGTDILVPAIVVHELRFGIAMSARQDANRRAVDAFLAGPVEIPNFDSNDATEAADIRSYLKRQGTPIGPYDVLIAAQARRRTAILVTGNVREFRRVPGLAVQNWTEE